MIDVTGDYEALRGDVGAVVLERDAVRVAGPDADSFLQGQLSQDLAVVPPRGAAWSWLLQPTGKVTALVRVARLDADTFVLDTDAGFGEAVMERLVRFKLRVKADVEPDPDWRCASLRGPKAGDVDVDAPVVHPDPWPGLPGVDLLGPSVVPPEGVRLCGPEAYEAVRIEAGVPKMGAELSEATMPHEAGRWVLERTVSFTKGCYTGQELVARVDSRGGNAPRRLLGVVVERNVLPPAGATLGAGGRDVGRLTSVGESLRRRAPVALALVQRAVDPPAEVTVTWDGGETPARVEALPLV